jgi:Flp pilus assembly protein TadB
LNYKEERRSNNSGGGGGIGFASLLTLIFIVLKLCKVINWSWIWVLSPMWISILLVVLIITICIVVASKKRR